MSAVMRERVAPIRTSIVPAKVEHIERMLPNIREADRAELWAGWRHTPEESLRFGLRYSSHVWTGCIDFVPVCMFGAVPASILGGKGVPWMIGTNELMAHQRELVRRSRPQLARLQAIYQHLENWVSADNEAAVRWLRWLGFTLYEPIPYGPDRELFRRFEWRSADV